MAQQPIVITTPTGVAQYPWLSKADTKYNEEGEFKTNLILSEADAEPLIKIISDVFAEGVKTATEESGKAPKTANPPFAQEFGDDGKPTGNMIIRFKSKYKPKIFDAAGKLMTESNIWGGSEIRVNSQVVPYFTALIGCGVSLRLSAVQVIKYVEGGTNANADNFGFNPVEGFTQPAEPTASDSGFEQAAPTAPTAPIPLSAEALPQSDLAVEQPILKDNGKAPVAAPADVNDIVKKWSVKN